MTKIIFLILPNIHLLDLAGPDQAFLEAIGYGADLAVEYCSVEKSVSTSSNLNIARLKMFSKVKINKGDYVFVPGTDLKFLTSGPVPFEKEVSKWLNDGHKKGAFICSICTGAFFLARTGLLNGRKCTTHWKRTAELKEKFPLVNLVEDVLFTEDAGIYTSAGVTAGIDMALFIIGKIRDDNFSFQVARELVVYIRRQGNESQQSVFMRYRNHIHSGIHTVQDYLQENIAQKTSLNDLGYIAFMSSRNLTRVFKKETGISINEYINLIRKERIRELVKNPDNTRALMARQCGLKSGRHVTRLLQTL